MARHEKGTGYRFWLAVVLSIVVVAVGVLAATHAVSTPHAAPQAVWSAPAAGSTPPAIITPPRAVQHHAVTVMHYTVRHGDTLWGIAKTHCGNPLAWPKLWHANKIKNPNLIYPEEKVILAC